MRGFDVEVIGTDADVDRRLSAVAEVDVPFYAGLEIGVPSVPAIVDAIAEGRYDIVHVCAPGPAGPRRVAARPGARAAARRQLPHRAGRLCRPAQRPGALEALAAARAGRSSTAPATWSCRRARPATSGSARLGSTAPDRGAGTAGSTSAVRSGAAHAGPAARRHQRALRRTADQGEGRRPAGGGVPGRARARSAPASGAGGRRSRGGALRDRLGDRATFLGLALRRAIWPAPTRAPTCSCSRAAPTRSARWCSRRRPAGCRSSPCEAAGHAR